MDAKGRNSAENVAFVGESTPSNVASGYSNFTLVLAIAFLAALAGFAAVGKLPFTLLGLYFAASLVAFITYALDKAAARKDEWRTAESTLHFFGLIGGWPGALVAQRLLRHKTKKLSFQLVFWATVVLNCAALAWLLSSSGMRLMEDVMKKIS